MNKEQKKSGNLTIIASVIGNIVMIIVKFALGVIGRSQALIVDSVHSFTDFATDILAFFGVYYAYKGTDQNHPFGHGKIDTLMSMLIGISMVITGLWLSIESMQKIINNELAVPNYWALIGAVISIVIKEILFQYNYKVGVKIGNQSLIANAWHHRSDAVSSVAVLLGVIPSLINPDLMIFDALAAAVVSAFIIKFGISTVIPAFQSASDAAPDPHALYTLGHVAMSVSGVRNVHDIRARYYSSSLYVEVHIVVDPTISVADGHHLAEQVRQKMKNEIENVLDVIVHVDPDDELWRGPKIIT